MMALRDGGRLAIGVGLVVAAVAATVLAAVAGVAQATPEPGRCTDNVNVRERPERAARIVGLCRTGTRVVVEDRRNGFVKLREFSTNGREGWAVARYVETSAPPSSRPTSTSGSRRAAVPAPSSSVPVEEPTPAAEPVGTPSQRDGLRGLLG